MARGLLGFRSYQNRRFVHFSHMFVCFSTSFPRLCSRSPRRVVPQRPKRSSRKNSCQVRYSSNSFRCVTDGRFFLYLRRKQETNAKPKQNQKVHRTLHTIKDISYSHIFSAASTWTPTPPLQYLIFLSHCAPPVPSSLSPLCPPQASPTPARSCSATKSKCRTACMPRQARWSHGGNNNTKKWRMCSS
jgi:hypothetical protein